MYDFQLVGVEFVFVCCYYVDGGWVGGYVEGDGFDGVVEVFVDFEYGFFLKG